MDHASGHELRELAAALVLVLGGGVHVALAWVVRSRGTPQPSLVPVPAPGGAESPPAASMAAGTVLVAVLSVAAGAIHLAAAPAHLTELGPLGWGFVAVAAFQGAWALAWAIDASRTVAVAAVAGNLAVVAAWLWSRSVGLPVGRWAGTPEPVGTPDGVAATLELLLVGLLVVRLTGLAEPLEARLRDVRSLAAIAVVPAVGVVVLATTLAVSSALGHDHGPGAAHDDAAPQARD